MFKIDRCKREQLQSAPISLRVEIRKTPAQGFVASRPQAISPFRDGCAEFLQYTLGISP